MVLSVIIPTLNEKESLPQCIAAVRGEHRGEVIVVDGGSSDGTLEVAKKAGAETVSALKGLAHQCNVGATKATGDLFLFLAADSRLTSGWRAALEEFFGNPYHSAGGFRLKLEHPAWGYRVIEWGGNFRARYLGITLPDQGLFVRAEAFNAIGGFNPTSLIPFARFCFEIRRYGEFGLLRLPVHSSVRKWERHGRFRTSFHHVRTYLRFKRADAEIRQTDRKQS